MKKLERKREDQVFPFRDALSAHRQHSTSRTASTPSRPLYLHQRPHSLPWAIQRHGIARLDIPAHSGDTQLSYTHPARP